MASRPVLGIICCNRIVGSDSAQAVMDRYVTASMAYANTAALLVPSLNSLMDAAEVAPRLDGVLLTGSPSNIETQRYRHEGGEGPFDPARDEIALGLIHRMIDAGKPVFGICRGFQEINVALGGTLRRDVSVNPEFLPHHAPDGVSFEAMFAHQHRVELAGGGRLALAYQRPDLTVNSVHYQGIGELSAQLQIEARADDGLIEAYSARLSGAPVLAVQWHPEWQTAHNPESQTYFHLLGKALRGEW
jgi:putative glutamine amidotransferase